MMRDGIYSKGDQCVKCGKVFGRKYAKRLHDDRCNGTIKRCGNSKGPSKARSAFIKEIVALCEMLGQKGLTDLYSNLSIEGIEDYIATGDSQEPQDWAGALGCSQEGRYVEVRDIGEIDGEIEAVVVSKFREGFRKWRDSAKVKSVRTITFGSRKISKEEEYMVENFIADYADWAAWVMDI